MKKIFLLTVFSGFCAFANEKAYFAGGCFWSMQKFFDHVDGVVATRVGYSGGDLANPSYAQVSTGNTGHREAIEVTYNPKKISYGKLVDAFWHDIDPTDPEGEFCDHGDEYKSAVFFQNDKQKAIAETSKKNLDDSKKLKAPVATNILKFKTFYAAEDYHQGFYKTHADDYMRYRTGCGRDGTLKKVWGDQAK